MATSGAVGQTLDVVSVVERAVRKCGVMPSVLGAEQLQNARDCLLLNLIALSNRGVNLWCVDKRVLGPGAGQQQLQLPLDVVDISNALYRTGTYTSASSYALGKGSVDLTTPAVVASATVVLPAAGALSLVLEYSSDNVLWFTAGTFSVLNGVAGQRVGVDASTAVSARYWRAGDAAAVAAITEVQFVSTAVEIPMSQLSKDAYVALPSKLFSAQQPIQYFFDKQQPAPRLWLWPTVQTLGPQVVLWVQRQIQDAGALTDTLDVPSRWLNAIIFQLAMQVCLELPKELVAENRYETLKEQAERYTRDAEDGEVDGAPVRITPNIGVYRG